MSYKIKRNEHNLKVHIVSKKQIYFYKFKLINFIKFKKVYEKKLKQQKK